MRRRISVLGLAGPLLVLAACGSSASSGPPSSVTPTSAPGSPTAAPTPGQSGAAATLTLRATETQAILPIYQFGWLPVAVITDDGRLLTPGAVDAIFPGPLVPPVEQRTISPAGLAAIAAEARSLGLLSGRTDFATGAGDMPMPGAKLGRLQLVVDGVTYDLTGDPGRLVRCGTAERCTNPTPGSPEAFAAFWARLSDVPGWLGADVGSASPAAPVGYAIIVGPPPAQPLASQPPVIFPLAISLTRFGAPILGDATLRCGSVGGAEAAEVGPILGAANTATQWVDDETTSATFGLTVRPILPGDGDPCEVLTRPSE